jgi:hypothetical protein
MSSRLLDDLGNVLVDENGNPLITGDSGPMIVASRGQLWRSVVRIFLGCLGL